MALTRCFVAIPVEAPTATALVALQPAHDAVRAVPGDLLHLTLHFLGEQDLPRVAELLQTVAVAPPRLVLSGLGTFESTRGARILWAGVEPTPSLRHLHETCARALAPIGFEPEQRPWRPHITLGRARAAFDPDVFLGQSPPEGPFHADGFQLYVSTLTEAGPVYERAITVPWRA